MFERTVTVFTLSKTYSMTGWRAGYVLVAKRWRTAMQTVVLYSINGVSTPTQFAAVQALSLSDDFLREAKEGYRRRRDALVSGLRAAGFEIGDQLTHVHRRHRERCFAYETFFCKPASRPASPALAGRSGDR